MKKFRMSARLRGESAMKAVSAAQHDVESALTFSEYWNRLMSLNNNRNWATALRAMADYAWLLLPKHKWMTTTEIQKLLGWNQRLLPPTFFQLERRRKGRRARKMPQFWASPRDHWGPPWSQLCLLLRPSDPPRKEIELAEQYYKNLTRIRLQAVSNKTRKTTQSKQKNR